MPAEISKSGVHAQARAMAATAQRLQAGIVVCVILLNVALLGLILAGHTSSLGLDGVSVRFGLVAVVSGLLCLWLGLRLRHYPIRLRHSQAMPLYTTCMLISVIVPTLAFVAYAGEGKSIELGSMLLAQSVFLVVCLGIKMNTSRHSF